MTQPVWRSAIETQLSSTRLLRVLENERHPPNQMMIEPEPYDWGAERIATRGAVPMGWSANSIRATWAASKHIGNDVMLHALNFPAEITWWWFEEPLPLLTTKDAGFIRALLIGYNEQIGLHCSVWIDDHRTTGRRTSHSMAMSMILEWGPRQTLQAALDNIRNVQKNYKDPSETPISRHVSKEAYLGISEALAKFVLAAASWLSDKVLVQTRQIVDRHLRKEFKRETGLGLDDGVNVVTLRKAERGTDSGETREVEWTKQWMVLGHWRNQRHGTGLAETKLRWIHPYVKGPDDKPFVAKTTVMAATR